MFTTRYIKIKKKWEEENNVLSISYSTCRRKHPLCECPLNKMHICAFCTEKHPIEYFLSLLGLRVVLNEGNGAVESLNFSAQKKSWKPRTIGNFQDFVQQFSTPQQFSIHNNQNLNTPIP
jgi:hypothetical protein